MNPELPGQLAFDVQLIFKTLFPALGGLALAMMVVVMLRAIYVQDTHTVASSPSSILPTPQALSQVFGDENVRTAKSLIVRPVQELLGSVEKFGGHPTGVVRAEWPRCGMCAEPLTFVGQIQAGRGHHVAFPEEGLLQIFVCSSVDARGGTCDTSQAHRGGAHVRFVPVRPDDVTLGEDAWEREVLASTVKRNESEPRGGAVKLSGVEKVGRDGRRYYPYLARQYALVSVELQPSVRMPLQPTSVQLALWTATLSALNVQVGGFPSWMRSPPQDACSCGAPYEVVMQLDPFDEVFRVPAAARVTVQACLTRHAHDAFRLFWQAP